jgi:hypothetical protein
VVEAVEQLCLALERPVHGAQAAATDDHWFCLPVVRSQAKAVAKRKTSMASVTHILVVGPLPPLPQVTNTPTVRLGRCQRGL